ncbi:MAG: ribulose-phosphate 3-epimerase [Dehalococcoidia bacterium]|nr:ribulose-phosphate 3-epimerase [Dehalococcoidia bacterium]
MKRSVRIVPAILTDSEVALSRMVSLANVFAPFVQVDIMDGVFVPTVSVRAEGLQRQDIRFAWEAHLMVAHPLPHLESFRRAGASRIIFHVEAEDEAALVILQARSLGLGVGVALNPPTPVGAIESFISAVDSVLLMTVYPGYYGAPFVPDVMKKVSLVRALRPDIEIGVDGGIKEGNLPDVVGYGVDTVCVGSAVFGQPDPAASFVRLSDLARMSGAR